MSLSDLYQEVILDHNRRPRHYGALADATHVARGSNPLCGDRLVVFVRLDGDRIADVAFEGSGCAISKASASLLTDAVIGRSVPEALALFDRFHAVITSPATEPLDEARDLDPIGKLAALAGVREFPIRVKCASLAWHTFKAALDGGRETTTEA